MEYLSQHSSARAGIRKRKGHALSANAPLGPKEADVLRNSHGGSLTSVIYNDAGVTEALGT